MRRDGMGKTRETGLVVNVRSAADFKIVAHLMFA